jgi:hypothetical protein
MRGSGWSKSPQRFITGQPDIPEAPSFNRTRMNFHQLYSETELEIIRRLIPPRYHNETFLAGSSAIVPDAQDIDIWVLAGEHRPVVGDDLTKAAEDQLDKRFCLLDYPQLQYSQEHSWQYNVKGLDKVYEFFDVQAWQRRRDKLPLPVPYIRKLQVMVTEFPDIETLLANFDLSVHAYAYDLTGGFYQGKMATTPSEQVRVQHFGTPHSTLRRYITISDRYHQKLNWGDVETLCRLVYEEAQKRADQLTADLGLSK